MVGFFVHGIFLIKKKKTAWKTIFPPESVTKAELEYLYFSKVVNESSLLLFPG